MEDRQLLEDYARTGSEAAFAQLVKRHLGLVHTAARRQVQDDALAADVAQAVFLLLARKAGSLGGNIVLSGWLFRTTRFVAARAQRAEFRRQRREQEAVAMQEIHTPDPHWNRLAPELDEALAGLAEADRNALLLRFAEGRNHREVGVALGLTEEAAKKRVNRALDKLRGVLAGKGVTLTVALLAGLLADRLVAAPPAGLATTITGGVVSGAAQGGIAGSLAQQVVAAWRWTRVKFAAVFVGAAALLTALVVTSTQPGTRPALLPEPVSTANAAAEPISHTPGVAPRLNGSETFRLQVVAADTGDPLPGARVPLNFVANGEWLAPDDLVTDAAGVCLVPLPRGALQRMDAGAHVPGFENRFFTWRADWQHPRPEGYTLRLGRAETVGGQVVDAQRRPLAGVSVWLTYHLSDTSWREPDEDRERLGFMRRIRLGATDAQGRWICATIPPARERFAFEFEHPDYVKEDSLSVSRDDSSEVGREVFANLRGRKAVTVLRAGLVAFGRVVDAAGEPVGGAKIAPAWHQEGGLTDVDGQFTVRRLPPGDVQLVATAEGFAPKRFNAVGGGEAVRVQLDPGGLLRARIIDTNGEPIVGATLLLDEGMGTGALGWDDTSDADGWVTWRSAPRNETRTFTAHAPGYRMARGFPLRTDGSEQTVTLLPVLTVVGAVVDAQTGAPVARFKAIPGEGYDQPNFDRSELHYGKNGAYRLKFNEAGVMAIRVEAQGYATEIGRPAPGPNGEPRCDFKLRREDPNGGIHGVVLNADGSPAAGAEVALCTLEHGVALLRGKFRRDDLSIITNTDSAGRFVFPPVRVPHTVAAVSPAGFVRGRVRAGVEAELRLQPFGAIEGVVSQDGQPVPKQVVNLVDQSYGNYSGAIALDVRSFQQETDAQGRFRIGFVPAGDFGLFRNPGIGIPFTDETKVSLSAGQTLTVTVGEPDPSGRTVQGRVRPAEPGLVTDWRRQLTAYSIARKLPAVKPPEGLSEDERRLWLVDWHQSEAGRAAARVRINYLPVFAPDGSFTARGVPPGDYQFYATAVPLESAGQHRLEARTAEWRGFARIEFSVPAESDGAEEPLDLGEIPMPVQRLQPK